jgi:prephenate dehydratase
MKVAIQGEPGSFSHEAARRMVPGCALLPCTRSVEVFDHLEAGDVPMAVIPIENTLAGTVTEHADLLLAREVFIQREFHLRIIHNLICPKGVKRVDLRRALSHPVALDQCRDFFKKNPQIQPTPFYDTAGSVKHVVETGARDAAGIASKHAAAVYKAHILAAGIEDDKRNFTRFFLLRRGKQKRILHAANKTLCTKLCGFSPIAISASAKSSRVPCAAARGNTSSMQTSFEETINSRAVRCCSSGQWRTW